MFAWILALEMLRFMASTMAGSILRDVRLAATSERHVAMRRKASRPRSCSTLS